MCSDKQSKTLPRTPPSHLEHELHLAHALQLLPHPLLRACMVGQQSKCSKASPVRCITTQHFPKPFFMFLAVVTEHWVWPLSMQLGAPLVMQPQGKTHCQPELFVLQTAGLALLENATRLSTTPRPLCTHFRTPPERYLWTQC